MPLRDGRWIPWEEEEMIEAQLAAAGFPPTPEEEPVAEDESVPVKRRRTKRATRAAIIDATGLALPEEEELTVEDVPE